MFVLPAGHPLAASKELRLADVGGLPFITAELATDGCEPQAWQDDWLVRPRRSSHDQGNQERNRRGSGRPWQAHVSDTRLDVG